MVDITARISQSKVIATKVHIVDAVGLDGLTNVTLTSPADGSYIILEVVIINLLMIIRS